jgi:hypothetical protein
VAMSNFASYNDLFNFTTNPKFETAELTGAGPFSMSVEVQAWAYGDANFLTWTSYTYGRGFADYHRAFAQAYLALPNIAGTLVGGMPSNVTVRTYVSGTSTYVGIAYTGLTPTTLSLSIPGSWPGVAAIQDLVTSNITMAAVGSALPLTISAGPMSLHAFLVQPGAGTPGAGAAAGRAQLFGISSSINPVIGTSQGHATVTGGGPPPRRGRAFVSDGPASPLASVGDYTRFITWPSGI